MGYAVGGGAEFLLSQNWTLRAEYLRYDFGKTATLVTLPTKETLDVVRAAVSYKF